MGYPTSPTEVGLSDPGASFTVYATRQTFTTSQSVANAIFDDGVNVGAGASVSFSNCWWRQDGVAVNLVNLTGDEASAVFYDCEFGNDGSNYPSAIVLASTGANTTAAFYRCYFHHVPDWGTGRASTVAEDCYFDDLILADPAQHIDIVQVTGGGPHSYVRCYLNLRLASDSPYQFDDSEVINAGGGPNRAFFVKPDLADLTGDVTLRDSYVNGVGSFVTQVNPSSFSFGSHRVVIRDNVYGSDYLTGPHSDNVGDELLWIGNTSEATGELLSGQDQGGPGVAATIQAVVTNAADNSADWTLTLPASAETDDWLIAVVLVRGSGDTLTLPSGWTLVTSEQWSTLAQLVTAKYKVPGSDTPGSTTYTFDNSNNFRDRCAVALLLRGADSTDCVAASADGVDSGFNTTYEAPAVTTTADDQLVLAFFAGANEGTTFSSPSPTMNQEARVTGTGVSATLAAYSYTQASAGSTGTLSVTSSNSGTSVGATIAIVSGASSAQDLTGTLHDVAPTFFTGAVAPGAVNLGGALLSVGPTFGSGVVGAGAVNLAGELTQIAPTFFSGVVSAGELALTGSLFQASPTFNAGAIAATYELSGSLFQAAPSFPQGDVANLSQFLAGTLFASSPTFFTGSLGGGDRPRRRNAVVTATRRSATLS